MSLTGFVSKEKLPRVFPAERTDIIQLQLKQQAATAFQSHVLPATAAEWEQYRQQLRQHIIRASGVKMFHDLPLNIKETGRVQQPGYTIRNITFQTRPGVYTTANLYVPDGKGPFPAVINMHGHWKDGRMGEMVLATAQSLAMSGYVCLNADAWGAGERTTVSGQPEYHGANLGASLLNTGNTLLGMQLTDNIRGVDLLCSLPEVDKNKIGATGASGGGNQTMWVSAIDERIKAAVPVVSVGTFESYILNSNCICELLPDGLTFTEEAGVLALLAPRALKICNAINDNNKSFYPSEMLRSYQHAASVFKLLQAGDKISYQIFNTTHGYWPEIREAMIGWMDLHLEGKGNGAPHLLPPVTALPMQELLNFKNGNRDSSVATTAAWCRREADLVNVAPVSRAAQRLALERLLKTGKQTGLKAIHQYTAQQGWERVALETTAGNLIPLLIKAPAIREKGYVIAVHPGGKDSVSRSDIQAWATEGVGIVLPDLWGTGEQESVMAKMVDGSQPPFHTLARSVMWLGGTVQGKWINDLEMITDYLQEQNGNVRIVLNGSKEAGIASLLFTTLGGRAAKVVLDGSPLSYRFDTREGIDYFTMAVHIPGILPWGDVPMAVALSKSEVEWKHPVTMAGREVGDNEWKHYQAMVQRFKKLPENK